MYSKLLSFASGDLQPILDITQKNLKGTTYEILVNSFWVEVIDRLNRHGSSIYAPGQTDAFHKVGNHPNVHLYHWLMHGLELHCIHFFCIQHWESMHFQKVIDLLEKSSTLFRIHETMAIASLFPIKVSGSFLVEWMQMKLTFVIGFERLSRMSKICWTTQQPVQQYNNPLLIHQERIIWHLLQQDPYHKRLKSVGVIISFYTVFHTGSGNSHCRYNTCFASTFEPVI